MGKSKPNKRPSLLDGDWFTHGCQLALEQIFRRFDKDRDGALSEDELQAFARACNGGESFDDDEIDQIKKFFETDPRTLHLTRKGFLQMYHVSCVAVQPGCPLPSANNPSSILSCGDRRRRVAGPATRGRT